MEGQNQYEVLAHIVNPSIHQAIIETSKSTNPVFEDLTFPNLENGNEIVESSLNDKEIERIRLR